MSTQVELIAKNIKGNVLKMQKEDGIEDTPFTRVIYLKKLRKIAEESTDMFPGYFLKLYLEVLAAMLAEQKELAKHSKPW